MTDPAPGSASGGSTALTGFLYQVEVSIWVALDLLLAKRLTRRLVLEAATEEDVEAELAEDGPGPAATAGDLATYALVVQAKMRDTGPWSLKAIEALLLHGKQRRSAAERLKDPRCRYLLVSNADLAAGEARNLIARTLGAWPSPTDLPRSLSTVLPDGAGGRVGVVPTLDWEKLDGRIRSLLESFRVPATRMKACRNALQAEALLRMRGVTGGEWTREGLEATLKAHDGIFASSAEVENFVKPTNWPQFKRQLLDRHAVIIDGPSGTGKTTAAHVLAAEMTTAVPGVTPVSVTQGPAQVWEYRNTAPVLFMIEDPWGKYRFEPKSEYWNDDLPKMLNAARADWLFIVTSRRDVLYDSRSAKLPRTWFVSLEVENYGDAERVKLFENRVATLPRAMQRPAVSHQQEVVGKLGSPLEIQKYFDAVAQGPETDESEAAFLKRCLASAHRDAIGFTLVQQVRQRDAHHLAAVAWGMLKARPQLSRAIVPAIEARLVERDREFEDRLEPFLNFLVASRNLRQVEFAVSYSHPTVEAGLVDAMRQKPALVARTLSLLIDALMALDEGTDDWGREAAALLVRAAKEEPAFTVNVSATAQQRLDSWLGERLRRTGTDLRRTLELAAAVGSEQSMPSELARWLLDGEMKIRPFQPDLTPPPPSAEWFSRIAADPDSEIIATAFVREVLPFTSAYYKLDFPNRLAQITPNITSAFLEAASAIVDQGFMGNDDTIAKGALVDLDGFGRVASEAVDVRRRIREAPESAEWLAAENGEYDEEYAEHVWESRAEEGHTANVFLAAYVERLRRDRGWTALRDHPLGRDLIHVWVADATSPPPSPEELSAMFEVGFGGPDEDDLWQIATNQWQPLMAPYLVKRLVAGHANESVRTASVRCLATHAPADGCGVIETLLRIGDTRRVLELFFDLDAARDASDPRNSDELLARLESLLPSDLKDAANALREAPHGAPEVRAGALAILKTLDPGSNIALRLRLARCLGAASVDVGHHLDVLTASDATDTATQAVELAVSLGLWDRVDAALNHPLADVRRVALDSLAARSTGPLPPRLLALASDRGSGVRRALLNLLNQRRDPSHLDALVQLVSDTWSDRARYYEQDAAYPIARDTASLLAEGPPIEDRALDALFTIAEETEDRSVQQKVLSAIAINSTVPGLDRVVDLSLERQGKFAPRLSAVTALWVAAARIDERTAARFTPEQLRVRDHRIAARMAVIVGECAADDHVIRCAQAVADLPERRVLLIPLMTGAFEKRRSLAEQVGKFLPPDRLAQVIAAFDDGPRLDREALEGLGSVRAVDAVTHLLPDLFVQPKDATDDET
jgi:hypothetical protein